MAASDRIDFVSPIRSGEGLHGLVAELVRVTDSRWARGLLDDWPRAAGRFWQVVPKEMLTRLPHPLSDAAALEAAE